MLPTYSPTGHNPESNADEKSHKELYVADLQATTPHQIQSHKELYVADLQATTPLIKCR